MKIELYSEYDEATLPSAVSFRGKNGYARSSRTIQHLVLIRWPDGRPCHLVNHWLMEKALGTLARETTKVYASQITHLVRYCYTHEVEFFDFTDEDFYHFSNHLEKLKKSNSKHSAEYIGGNHVRAVQQRALHFFLWIHKNYSSLSSTPLIGESENCQIIIETRASSYNGRKEVWHRYLKPPEPPKDDKNVITEKMIQALFNAIFVAHDIDNLPTRAKTKQVADPELFTMRNTFLYERRIFTIKIMKLTGLRPEELIDIPLELNQSVTATRRISLPTKKQGVPAPIRKFDISTRAALDFQRYLDNRRIFIDFLLNKGLITIPSKSILIGDNGKSIKKSSITKEFSRLCVSAGFFDVRCCLSMFRHRFITRGMHLLLLERFTKNPELRTHWTHGLREDVCNILIRQTGHRQAKSLYGYFHEEYRLLISNEHWGEHMNTLNRLSDAQDSAAELKHLARLQDDAEAYAQAEEIDNLVNSLYIKLFGGKPIEEDDM